MHQELARFSSTEQIATGHEAIAIAITKVSHVVMPSIVAFGEWSDNGRRLNPPGHRLHSRNLDRRRVAEPGAEGPPEAVIEAELMVVLHVLEGRRALRDDGRHADRVQGPAQRDQDAEDDGLLQGAQQQPAPHVQPAREQHRVQLMRSSPCG